MLRAGAAVGRTGYTGGAGGDAGGSPGSDMERGWERLIGWVSEVSSSVVARGKSGSVRRRLRAIRWNGLRGGGRGGRGSHRVSVPSR